MERTIKEKLENLLNNAKKNLNISLYYVNCENLECFLQNKEEIKNNNSFHKYDDIIKNINYIEKLEKKLKKY